MYMFNSIRFIDLVLVNLRFQYPRKWCKNYKQMHSKKIIFQYDFTNSLMYQKVQGLLELRKSIAAYYTHKYGTEYTADDVLIGPGSKELMYILQKVYQADLYLPQASWVSYAPQAELLGRKVFWLKGKQENGFRFSIDEFMKITKDIPQVPKLVILNYPCNPTGTM